MSGRAQDRQQVRQTSAAARASATATKSVLSRRKMFGRMAGVAVTGAAGAVVLTDSLAPARAEAATTVESGAIAPSVVSLSDAATIAVDASQGNDFRVTIAASRAMGDPLNPVDGQKTTFQITQGGSGSCLITWGSSFEFGAGLPQPTLSTATGQTDLVGFIYNEQKGKWLCVAFVQGFSSTIVTPPPGTYRLFPSTNGPTAPVAYSGPFQAGVLFEVTTGGVWLEGFWWWVCSSGQSTTAQTFALWEVYNTGLGTLIPAATVTSGPLTAGQWNYVALNTPIPLAVGACYSATTGFSGGFPDTSSQFGANDPYAAGIVNGPLTAFSDQSGTLPAPFAMPQGTFGVAGTDPTATMPANGSSSSNFWMDVQVTTTAPTGTSYRLWPNYPSLPGSANGSAAFTIATEFQLSEPCTLDNIWFYSAPSSTILPSRCAIWNVSTQTEVAGTDTTAPAWSGGAGSGWVGCPYSGVTLPAGDYKVAVFSTGGAYWFQATAGYWAAGDPGGNGIASGPMTAPGLSTATSPGQSTYNEGAWAYPLTYGAEGNGENYWVDVEVTPS